MKHAKPPKRRYTKTVTKRAPYDGSKTSGDLSKGIKTKIKKLEKDLKEWNKILKGYEQVQKRLKD